jgi:hypothetical protein
MGMKYITEWKLFESASPGGYKLWEVNLDVESVNGDFMDSYLVAARNFREALKLIDSEIGGGLTNANVSSVFPGFLDYSSEEEVNKNLANDLMRIGEVENNEDRVFFNSEDFTEIDFKMKEINNTEDFKKFMRDYARFVDYKWREDEWGESLRNTVFGNFGIVGSDAAFASAFANLYKNGPDPVYPRLWWISLRDSINRGPKKVIDRYKSKYEAVLSELIRIGSNYYDEYREMERNMAISGTLTTEGAKVMNELSKEESISMPEAYTRLFLERGSDQSIFYRTDIAPGIIDSMEVDIDPETYKIFKALTRQKSRIL